MKVFFYCTYEHSMTGFFLSRLEKSELVPAAGKNLPEEVDEFFSYDRFRLLWRELCRPAFRQKKPPVITGGIFGVRGLSGQMADGRNATVNFIILAGADEVTVLKRTALKILGDFDGFRRQLFGWLSAGGPCSYQLDVAAFHAFLDVCASYAHLKTYISQESDPAGELLRFMARSNPPETEAETLRLAVCTASWEQVAPVLGSEKVWAQKPKCVLTQQEFDRSFTQRGLLWEMVK